jgi:hypothetical protein
LVLVGETGTNTLLSPLYAYSPGGHRAYAIPGESVRESRERVQAYGDEVIRTAGQREEVPHGARVEDRWS